VNLRRSGNGTTRGILPAEHMPVEERNILNEQAFQRMISLERKRTERSGKPFLLMLLDMGDSLPSDKNGKALGSILSALSLSTRETDVTGWYKNGSVVGVMFTEIAVDDRATILTTMMTRVSETLRNHLSSQQFNQVSISFHLFPEDWDQEIPQRPGNPTLYPDLSRRDDARKFFSVMKRVMDIVGSALAIVFLAPVFLAVALAVKLTSEGPVLFRQERIGQYGASFVFLKFRSMHTDNDASEHKAYVKKLIRGDAQPQPGNGNSNGNGQGVYKLTKDSRVTPVGAFLRKMSLDELPQFFNVLKGEMSLVGPRPAIAYEVQTYDIWHRRRVLEAKPGITGLWQINGRSRIKFDEMVRLDLRYARTWSPWMDMKILLRTPAAVVFGDGAY
jgi:lipopolysaccharide/colanic/teichoic acid biosynthesis glycosyltransferase